MFRLPAFMKHENGVLYIFPMLVPAFDKKFGKRDVNGRTRLLSTEEEYIIIETWNQHGHFIRKIPKKIELTPELLNLLGRWYGDRAGDGASFGISTTNPNSMKQFVKVFTNHLKQPKSCIRAQITAGSQVKENCITKMIQLIQSVGIERSKISICNFKKSGGFAHSINVSVVAKNAPASMFILQPLTNPETLEMVFKQQRHLFYAFLAGHFDADGVIDPKL